MDLSKIRAHATKEKVNAETYGYIIEAIDTIQANKAFLVRSEAVEKEFEGNKAAIAAAHAQIAGIDAELVKKQKKKNDLDKYISGGYKTKEKQMEDDLVRIKEEKLAEFDDSLEGTRTEIANEKSLLLTLQNEVAETKEELRQIQVSVREILT